MNTDDEDVRLYLSVLTPFRAKLGHRLVLLDSLNQDELANFGTGILFVFATWSIQPRIALKAIADLLNEDEFANVILYVVAIENLNIGIEALGKVRIGGWGETIWLRDGQIVYSGSNYTDADMVDLRTATRTMLLSPTEIMARKFGA